MRGAWVFRNGELIEKHKALVADAIEAANTRSDLPCPMIMSDIGEYRSMIDGSMITSRSHHRNHLKAHGCIEVGNETPGSSGVRVKVDSAEVAKDVKEAIEQVRAGYVPPEGPIGTRDEDGNIIEKPEIYVDATGVGDGAYLRSEAVKPA